MSLAIRSEFAANQALSAKTSATADSITVDSNGKIVFDLPGVQVSSYRSSDDYGFRNDVTSFRRQPK